MQIPKLAALALALSAWVAPAAAAVMDYALTIPLVEIGSPDTTPPALLLGTLSYDNSEGGISTFSLSDSTGIYAGWAWLLPLSGTSAGILFDGSNEEGSSLYFNIVASSVPNTIVSSPVNFCSVGCAMFKSIGTTMAFGTFAPFVPSGGAGTLPGTIVSPVPLPPAASLFLGTLAVLGSMGIGRRLTPRLQVARVEAMRPSRAIVF